jgi:hypothetical protein
VRQRLLHRFEDPGLGEGLGHACVRDDTNNTCFVTCSLSPSGWSHAIAIKHGEHDGTARAEGINTLHQGKIINGINRPLDLGGNRASGSRLLPSRAGSAGPHSSLAMIQPRLVTPGIKGGKARDQGESRHKTNLAKLPQHEDTGPSHTQRLCEAGTEPHSMTRCG